MSQLDNSLDAAVKQGKLCKGGVLDLLADVPYQQHLDIIKSLQARNPSSLDLQVKQGSTADNFSLDLSLKSAPSPSTPSALDSINPDAFAAMAKSLGKTPEQLRRELAPASGGGSEDKPTMHEEGVTTSTFKGRQFSCEDVKHL